MSVSGSETVRIWLVDQLYHDMSFDDFSGLAEELAERIFELNSNGNMLSHDASQQTREGRMPIDKTLLMDNGIALRIKELYFESAEDESILMFRGKSDAYQRNFLYFADNHCWTNGPMSRQVTAPDKKVLLEVYEDISDYCKSETDVAKRDGNMYATGKWIDENPEWSFEKLVRDALPMYLIESEL